jgi:hypothetical protein
LTQAGYSRIEKVSSRVSFEKLEEIAAVFEMDVRNIISFDMSDYLDPVFKSSGAGRDSALNSLCSGKITLLEKLLEKNERELDLYKSKFGCLYYAPDESHGMPQRHCLCGAGGAKTRSEKFKITLRVRFLFRGQENCVYLVINNLLYNRKF